MFIPDVQVPWDVRILHYSYQVRKRGRTRMTYGVYTRRESERDENSFWQPRVTIAINLPRSGCARCFHNPRRTLRKSDRAFSQRYGEEKERERERTSAIRGRLSVDFSRMIIAIDNPQPVVIISLLIYGKGISRQFVVRVRICNVVFRSRSGSPRRGARC